VLFHHQIFTAVCNDTDREINHILGEEDTSVFLQ